MVSNGSMCKPSKLLMTSGEEGFLQRQISGCLTLQ
uniref:Uncharacterized protein n=1 Tax=Setaria italica TaxID=4555 RepID=K4APD5_SETIT